jgi:hypothetical protein
MRSGVLTILFINLIITAVPLGLGGYLLLAPKRAGTFLHEAFAVMLARMTWECGNVYLLARRASSFISSLDKRILRLVSQDPRAARRFSGRQARLTTQFLMLFFHAASENSLQTTRVKFQFLADLLARGSNARRRSRRESKDLLTPRRLASEDHTEVVYVGIRAVLASR